jgi:hypothetical protein
MGTTVWVGLGVAAWLCLAVVVALWIGRMIRRRDEQVPRPAPRAPQPRGPRRSREAVDDANRYLHDRS